MRQSNRFIIASLFAVSIVSFALAADGFSIKRIAKVNDSAKWKLKATFDVQGQSVEVTGTTQEDVTDVAADGSITLKNTQLDQHVMVQGSEIQAPASPGPEISKIKSDGEVSEIQGDAGSPAGYRIGNLQALIDPGKMLNIGDTWGFEFKADAKTGAVAAKASYKLLGEEKVGNFDTLKISTEVKETDGTDPASSIGTVWIDKTNGQMVKFEAKWTNVPLPGTPFPLTGSVTVERV